MSDHDNIPSTAKWVADFINRIGFPIFAFCVIAYILFVKLGHMEENYTTQTTKMVTALNDNSNAVTALRHFLTHRYDDGR